MESCNALLQVSLGSSGFVATHVMFLWLSSVRRGRTRTELVELPSPLSALSMNENDSSLLEFQPSSSQRSVGLGRDPSTRQRNSTDVSAFKGSEFVSIDTESGETGSKDSIIRKFPNSQRQATKPRFSCTPVTWARTFRTLQR